MRIIQNQELDNAKWESLLEKNKYASPFQTIEYYNFLNSLSGFSSDVFALEENGKYTCLGVISIHKEKGIKSYFSRRGIIYGGLMLSENTDSQTIFFLQYLKNYYQRKLIYLEIRNYFDYSAVQSLFSETGFKFTPWLNFQIDTSEMDSIRQSMSSSRLRQIKKSLKSGASWHEANSSDEIKEFYAILKNLYLKKIHKPLFPIEFFLEFFNQNIGKFLLVYYKDKVIGGIMCPIENKKAIYEFYVCGLDYEFKEQYPSIMATYAALEYAHINKIAMFDFMGAGSPDIEYGVRDFKARFGGKLVEFGRYKYIYNKVLYKLGILGLKMISLMRK